MIRKYIIVADDSIKGFDEGIAQLEREWDAEEIEPCNDYISRQAVLKAIKNLYPGIPFVDINGARLKWLRKYKPYFECEKVVEQLPPITPQPKTDVLDKIRAEIETKYGHCDICEYFEDYDYDENDISEYRPIGDIADILQIIDKYKAESEE